MHFVVFKNHEYIVAKKCTFFYFRMFDISESEDSDFDAAPKEEVLQVAPKVTGVKHMNEIVDILELTKYQKKKLKKIRKRKEAKARKLGAKQGGAIQTIASRSNDSIFVPEVVTFVAHKKKRETENLIVSENIPNEQDSRKEISMKQARFEVFKLGVGAMDKKDQVDANTALAIRLGAKPAKNEAMEYEKFKEKRSLEKEEQKRKIEEDRNNLKIMKQKKKGTKEKGKTKPKKKEQMKVGSFDGGMLKLSAKDLSRLKGSK